MIKCGIASLGLFKIDRIHYSMFDVERSMFDVHQFLFRFDWTLAASGAAHMKLHQKVFVRSSKSRLKTAPTIYNNAMHLW
jgi:hypothetical protein